MDWHELQDPDNPENRNAGNGGDLGKHSVYLATLRYLMAREPWAQELRVRECHAGRGMYRIPADDGRRHLLRCLYSPENSDASVGLHHLQRASQSALAVWPAKPEQLVWYTGSAVLNAWSLSAAGTGAHLLELYERAPATRRILRSLLSTSALQLPRIEVQIQPDPEDESDFDGELHVANSIESWDSRDLVMLDPFAMWRQEQDWSRREQYGRVVDAIIAKEQNSAMLILFWTWEHAFPVAEGDLNGTNQPVENGYQALRSRLHQARRRFVRVTWRWGLQFAMWVLVPDSHLAGICAAVRRECDATRSHLVRHGCGGGPANAAVEVVVD